MRRSKLFEVRDRATFIPVMAVELYLRSSREAELFASVGWQGLNRETVILLSRLDGAASHYDVYDWGDRTMSQAHHYILNNFDELVSGDVVDIEFILGETTTKKEPQ
jgi:hypothetical protein